MMEDESGDVEVSVGKVPIVGRGCRYVCSIEGGKAVFMHYVILVNTLSASFICDLIEISVHMR